MRSLRCRFPRPLPLLLLVLRILPSLAGALLNPRRPARAWRCLAALLRFVCLAAHLAVQGINAWDGGTPLTRRRSGGLRWPPAAGALGETAPSIAASC